MTEDCAPSGIDREKALDVVSIIAILKVSSSIPNGGTESDFAVTTSKRSVLRPC